LIVKVAVPRVGDSIAPRFEHSATITIYTIQNRRVVDDVDYTLQSTEAFDRIRLLRNQGVETLICGGVETAVESILEANGIESISWVSGSVAELLELFIRGKLVSGAERRGTNRP
jgi:predicted Fe-Mo cluster-binding NifX family protein